MKESRMEWASGVRRRKREVDDADPASANPGSPHRTPHLFSNRDASLREQYLRAALPHIPRLLGAIDRNPFRPTYGCFDRQFWHYRTADFPSEMHQEGVWPLALVYTHPFPGNRWHGQPRVRELAIAALCFNARRGRRDGSCDDYYPFERALGAAVFSLVAAGEAYELLGMDDGLLRAWFDRRARWVAANDESGRLANHHALAALGLELAARITGRGAHRTAAESRARRVLEWQSEEGWFEEYGGADPGYQTVTIDCLSRYRRLTGAGWLDQPLRRAVDFARWFLHPDDSFGGEYGSRGTHHFYPCGMELLAAADANAADLSDAFQRALAAGRHAWFDDDRLFAHRLGNLLQAWLEWSPIRPSSSAAHCARSATRYFPAARLLVRRTSATCTVISAARGGVFKHFTAEQPAITDAGLIVELADGRVAVSQAHDRTRSADFVALNGEAVSLSVSGPLHEVRFETATPLKQMVFRGLLLTAGRWCRTLVRTLLQRRLITGRRACPVQLARRFEFPLAGDPGESPRVRITDTIELTGRGVQVRRMSFGTDHQTAYVAASGVYQDSALQPWLDLSAHIGALNRDRAISITREF
jgi:hypothetical protein